MVKKLFVQSRIPICILLFSLVASPLSTQASQKAAASVAFLSPDNSRFWQMVGDFMHAVANDLDIDLTIHTDQEKNRFSYRELLREVLDRPDLPDYIVLMCKEKVTHDMLTMIGESGIKAFTFNTDVPDGEASRLGDPREKLSHWIGHLSPDNQSAGFTLAKRLYARFETLTGSVPDIMVGLSGTRDSSAAIDRNKGFHSMLESHPSTTGQILFADWSEQEATIKMKRLVERYDGLDLVWSASDGMALGAMAGAIEKGRKPGKDLLIGGIDWEQRTLDEIENGRLELSLGRHFMGGGLALLLIRDYHAGFDFADGAGVKLSYQFEEVTRENLGAIRKVLDPVHWEETDYRQFSQSYNESLRGSMASASAILDDFMAAMSPGFR